MNEMREKVRKLESECILSIGKAREEGKEEGKAEGKVLGKEEAMDEVKAQFQMVYNSGFRHGWKFVLSKTEQPETSELFLRMNTPLLYPEAVSKILMTRPTKRMTKMTRVMRRKEDWTKYKRVCNLN